MADDRPSEVSKPAVVDVRQIAEWQTAPKVGFDKEASFSIAKWILILAAGIYALSFISVWACVSKADATFKDIVEVTKFFVQSIIPLVTLAVGYYLGDRKSAEAQAEEE